VDAFSQLRVVPSQEKNYGDCDSFKI